MVPNCTFKEPSGFCKFPSDPELLKKWCDILTLPLFEPKSQHKVCRRHFEDEDFFQGAVIKKLKPNRVPSRFLPIVVVPNVVEPNVVEPNVVVSTYLVVFLTSSMLWCSTVLEVDKLLLFSRILNLKIVKRTFVLRYI